MRPAYLFLVLALPFSTVMANEIDSLMQEARVFPPPETVKKHSYIQSRGEYDRLYRESIESPDTFWARQAQEHLEWFKPWDSVLSYDFTTIGEKKYQYVQWFTGSTFRVSLNFINSIQLT